MQVVFLAFANRREAPLPNLQEEDEQIYRLLSARALRQHYLLHRDSYADLEKIAYFLTLYRDSLALFLYSGHAKRDALLLEDETAHGGGIAHLLGQCPNLRAVMLNGCSTQGQVEGLLSAGVPLVVATSAPVDDEQATRFSIRLFQALSEHYSLSDAFELAIGETLSRRGAFEVHRGVRLPGGEPAIPLWGIFHREDRPEAPGWTLPAAPALQAEGAFVPNAIFIEALLEAFAPYSEEVAQLREAELLGAEKSILDKREAILKCLPHPVSEQLRKLLVPESGGGGVFFDKLGPERLRQMMVAYNTIIELMAFVMLAQLWDALGEREDLRLPPEQVATIRRFFTLRLEERAAYNFFPLISDVRGLFDLNGIPYFVEELDRLKDLFHERDSSFHGACLFMEGLKSRLAATRLAFDAGEAANLCVLAEEKLTDIIRHLGFIANYTLASVKNIAVIKNRGVRSPHYRHHLVKLVQRFVGLAEEQDIMDKIMDNASVVLRKQKGGGPREYLNLTPFIIDESAFDENAALAKLYFFGHYDPRADVYAFKHVYKPEDPPLFIGAQRNYALLKAQFDAFAQLLFQQSMRAL
jgi:hypothetical protein